MENNEPIKCPHCGKSYYKELYGTSTCMYFPPIWKDGVNVNPDGNIHSTYCHCLECDKDFIIKRCRDDVTVEKE